MRIDVGFRWDFHAEASTWWLAWLRRLVCVIVCVAAAVVLLGPLPEVSAQTTVKPEETSKPTEVTAVTEFLPLPEFIDWDALTEQNRQLLNSAEFLSQFSMKRHYRLEPWLEKLLSPDGAEGVPDLPRMQNDVNRTILEIWREQTLRPQFERHYAQGKPLGCVIVTFQQGVPLEFWLDALSMAAEIRVVPEVQTRFPGIQRIQTSAVNVYGLPGGTNTDKRPAVALLAYQLSPETLKQAEQLEKLGVHVDFVSEEMLSRATVTLKPSGEAVPSEGELPKTVPAGEEQSEVVPPPTVPVADEPQETTPSRNEFPETGSPGNEPPETTGEKPEAPRPVLGIGAMEYTALYVASDVKAIQPETDAFFQRLAKQGCPVRLAAKLELPK